MKPRNEVVLMTTRAAGETAVALCCDCRERASEWTPLGSGSGKAEGGGTERLEPLLSSVLSQLPTLPPRLRQEHFHWPRHPVPSARSGCPRLLTVTVSHFIKCSALARRSLIALLACVKDVD